MDRGTGGRSTAVEIAEPPNKKWTLYAVMMHPPLDPRGYHHLEKREKYILAYSPICWLLSLQLPRVEHRGRVVTAASQPNSTGMMKAKLCVSRETNRMLLIVAR